MLKNNGSKSSATRKTIRLGKNQFVIMMVITPFFAAYVSILTMMAIFQPWKNNETEPIEVPVLGDVTEKTGTETERTIVINKVVEKEVEKKDENRVEESTTANAIQKSLFVQPKDIKQATKPSETKKTETKKVETKETPKTEDKKEEPKEEKPVEKSAEEIAKETCEATPSNYTTYITVHFFDIFERVYLKALGVEKENPVVDYKKYVVKNSETAKMVYQNGTCTPSKANLELVDDPILSESDLEEYGISAKADYEIWL